MIANETNRRGWGRTVESLFKKITFKFYTQVAGKETNQQTKGMP